VPSRVAFGILTRAMSTTDILEQLGALSLPERLSVLESALHRIREELAGRGTAGDASQGLSEQITRAAEALRQDYTSDDELTAFTALDGEPLHEAG